MAAPLVQGTPLASGNAADGSTQVVTLPTHAANDVLVVSATAVAVGDVVGTFWYI